MSNELVPPPFKVVTYRVSLKSVLIIDFIIGTTTDECSLPTKRQRFASFCCDSIFHYDGPDELEDNYIFDIFTTNDDENGEGTRAIKLRKLSTAS